MAKDNNYFNVTFTCKILIIPGQFKSRDLCAVPTKIESDEGHLKIGIVPTNSGRVAILTTP